MSEPAPPKKRGRPPKSASATPQPQAKPRARSTSAQPAGPERKTSAGVKGRKPKLAVVPETQVEEISVVEEVEEEDEVEIVARPRQGSILAGSVARKPSLEVRRPRIEGVLIIASCEEQSSQGVTDSSRKEFRIIQRTCRKAIQRYALQGMTLTLATDELVASLTAQLEHQKDTVNPSQLKELESKGLLPSLMVD